MRAPRTIYFDDARHYYLFVFEPPMRLEDARRPVDQVAGTAVDTFIYGVSRGDGLFYPSRIGRLFGAGRRPFQHAYEWRSWENVQSLIGRGLDPLSVLIDRAHQKGMDFFASLRMGGYEDMPPEYALATGGRGFVHAGVRDHQFAVLEELATQYPVEGVELDFAAAPGGSPFWLRPEDAPDYTPVMTDFVRQVAGMVRNRPGRPGQVGARVYPTQDLNLRTGLDVRTWLREGLVDFVVPLIYGNFVLDADMPIGWLVEAAHENGVSVYGMLQPYYRDEGRRFYPVEHATPAMLRAAVANLRELGVDGLYTWFLPWPLGDAERRVLTELGDPDLIKEGDKHYFLRRRSGESGGHDYEYNWDGAPHGYSEVPQSIRMNDNHFEGAQVEDLQTLRHTELTRMRVQHPEWLLGDQTPEWFAMSWNFAVPEVREHRFAHISEVCARYDWDGVELDWQRHAFHLPQDDAYRLRYTLTDLQRAVRRLTDDLARRRGRPFHVAARVAGSLDVCRRIGYDAPLWVEEGLVDILIPAGGAATDPSLEVEAFVGLCRDRGIAVYPGFDSGLPGPFVGPESPEVVARGLPQRPDLGGGAGGAEAGAHGRRPRGRPGGGGRSVGGEAGAGGAARATGSVGAGR